MRPLLLILVLPVLFFSCGKKNNMPGDVLPPAKMEAVMWDMMRADQFLNDYVFSKDPQKDKDKESVILYKKIFSFHQVSQEEFQKSITYYRNHPLQLKPILDSIQNKKQIGATPSYPVTPIETKPADTAAKAPPSAPAVIPPKDTPGVKPWFKPIKPD